MQAQLADPLPSFSSPVISSGRRRATELEAEIIELCGHMNAKHYRFLQLIAEFDRDEHWARHGSVNCAQWLNSQCGLGGNAAREHVRVARALEDLPKISEVFSRGEISYSKVRAMTRIAAPENEDTLVTVALNGTASDVERLVRKYRRFERLEETAQAEARYRQRHVYYLYDDDGSLIIHAKLPPEIGDVVKKAIDAAVEELYQDGMRIRREDSDKTESNASAETVAFVDSADEAKDEAKTDSNVSAETSFETDSNVSAETTRSEEKPLSQNRMPGRSVAGASAVEEMETQSWVESLSARRADALRLIAERSLSGDLPKRSSSTADRYQVVIHIDQALLAQPASAGNTGETSTTSRSTTRPESLGTRPMLDRCEFDDGQALAIETARRLSCDSSLIGIVEDRNGEPLNVGRKTRSISPALSRALRSRDGGCRFTGCDRTLFTEGHHVKHWADGGETKLSNLITLCGFHHQLVHEGGFGMSTADDGAFVFTRPDGTRVEQAGRRSCTH